MKFPFVCLTAMSRRVLSQRITEHHSMGVKVTGHTRSAEWRH
jgi:hypothetical protein